MIIDHIKETIYIYYNIEAEITIVTTGDYREMPSWVLLQMIVIDEDIFPVDVTGKAVKYLDDEKNKVRADCTVKLEALEDKKQRFMALEAPKGR